MDIWTSWVAFATEKKTINFNKMHTFSMSNWIKVIFLNQYSPMRRYRAGITDPIYFMKMPQTRLNYESKFMLCKDILYALLQLIFTIIGNL